jgi:Cu(I)/Ag(I) efflux system membrane fusion protein
MTHDDSRPADEAAPPGKTPGKTPEMAPKNASKGAPKGAPKGAARRSGGGARMLAAVLLGLALGRFACGPSTGLAELPGDELSIDDEQQTVWTCSMHPQVRLPESGQCPICSMDLIPLTDSDDGGLHPNALSMSENAVALAEIVTEPVARRSVTREVRMVGKVAFDETRLSYITAWVPSRLDRLFVDYTGITVRKGDHLAEVYSPDLIATQQELILAIQTERLFENNPAGVVKARQAASVQSARDRLRLWGLDAAQIDEIVERGEPFEHITINSPVSGVVVHKNALQGDYVQIGTRIYTIADLTKVWVQLDAYESDLAWLHYGQHVEFVTEAWPGETFHGRISFIDPVLDDRTRTVKVRLNVDNSSQRLKPEMFVSATVLAPITAAGILIDPELADMWMCPMHPEVVSEEEGECSICAMDLVPTAELGFHEVDAARLPLVIPATAPLLTGKRAVVYVRLPETDRPTYEGRVVVLGPRVGDWYVVDEGLAEGEQIVVHGGFKIDSELQIRAKPSMMSPSGGAPPSGHQPGAIPSPKSPSKAAPSLPEERGGAPAEGALPGAATSPSHEHGGVPTRGGAPAGDAGGEDGHQGHGGDPPISAPPLGAFREQLGALVGPYVQIQGALAGDDQDRAQASAQRLSDALETVNMGLLDSQAHQTWMGLNTRLSSATRQLTEGGDLNRLRPAFRDLSDALIEALELFGYSGVDEPVSVFHCPMAFGNGADWIQPGPETANPYFGEKMLRCGDRVRELGGDR